MSRFNIYDEHGKKIGEMRDAINDDHDSPETETFKKLRELEKRQKKYSAGCWIIGFGIAILMWVIIYVICGAGKAEPQTSKTLAIIVLKTIFGSFFLSALSGFLMMGRLNIIFAAIAWGNIAILVLGIILSIVH